MNLKQTIRRVLIQETKFPKYLRRRTTMDDLDTAFEEASDYIITNNTFNYLPPDRIKTIIINVVMDHLHPKFSNWGMEEFDYDKIHEFLMNHYSNKMDRKLNISNKEETNESDPKVGTGKKPKGSSRRLYTDENPKDTVSVKFRTKQDIIDTLNKESFKSKPHKRQSQIINLIHQRLRVMVQRTKDPEVKKRLKTAFEYIEKKKEESKRKTQRMNESNNKKINCECGWSWKLEDGGDDPYTCHKCGKINSEKELTEKCWQGYTQKGMKTMFGKRYPNCVKKIKK